MASFIIIMAFYLILSVVLAWAGNHFLQYDYWYGFILGVIISLFMWFTVGKNMITY